MATALKSSARKTVYEMPEIRLKVPQPFYFVIKIKGHKLTDQELYEIDAANEHLRIESNANGDLEIMPPPFPETSRKNIDIDAITERYRNCRASKPRKFARFLHANRREYFSFF
jgi:hypothetical protein